MFNTRAKLLTVVAVTALVSFTARSADACARHWGCGYGWGAGYGASYSVGYGWYGGYGGCSSCETFAPASSSCAGGMCSASYWGSPGYSTYYWGYPSYSTYYWGYPGYSTYYWGYPASYQSYYPTYYSAPVYDGGCSDCQGSTISYNTPFWTVKSAAPKAAPSPAPTAYEPSTQVAFTVRVPADAKVYVNDRLTTSIGTERSYVSRGLKPGSQYGFTVRTERTVAGRVLSETQVLRLTAGQTDRLAFTLEPARNTIAQAPQPLAKLASRP